MDRKAGSGMRDSVKPLIKGDMVDRNVRATSPQLTYTAFLETVWQDWFGRVPKVKAVGGSTEAGVSGAYRSVVNDKHEEIVDHAKVVAKQSNVNILFKDMTNRYNGGLNEQVYLFHHGALSPDATVYVYLLRYEMGKRPSTVMYKTTYSDIKTDRKTKKVQVEKQGEGAGGSAGAGPVEKATRGAGAGAAEGPKSKKGAAVLKKATKEGKPKEGKPKEKSPAPRKAAPPPRGKRRRAEDEDDDEDDDDEDEQVDRRGKRGKRAPPPKAPNVAPKVARKRNGEAPRGAAPLDDPVQDVDRGQHNVFQEPNNENVVEFRRQLLGDLGNGAPDPPPRPPPPQARRRRENRVAAGPGRPAWPLWSHDENRYRVLGIRGDAIREEVERFRKAMNALQSENRGIRRDQPIGCVHPCLTQKLYWGGRNGVFYLRPKRGVGQEPEEEQHDHEFEDADKKRRKYCSFKKLNSLYHSCLEQSY